MLDYFVGTRGFYLGDHEGLGGGGDYDCAWQAQRSRRMHGSEPGVAARGAEDVWDRRHVWANLL
jgi:hypothetical protein